MVTKATLLDRTKDLVPVALDDEADFLTQWESKIDSNSSPEAMAFTGGALSDRLAFLFICGYQAAITKTFGNTGPGWSALAVSEDRSPENPKPCVSLTNDGTLSGYKTWVACSDTLNQLIISAAADKPLLLKISKDQPGLTITRKGRQKFLGDMSQGIAHLDQIPLSDLQVLPEIDLKVFAKREPLYLYFAACGFLQARLQHEAVPDLLERLLTIASGDFTDPTHKAMFADVDISLNRVFATLPNDLFSRYSEADGKLISMYSPVIQKRAGRG